MHRPFHTMTRGTELTPEEVAAALAEAKARGLPDGWKVSLDVSLDRLGDDDDDDGDDGIRREPCQFVFCSHACSFS